MAGWLAALVLAAAWTSSASCGDSRSGRAPSKPVTEEGRPSRRRPNGPEQAVRATLERPAAITKEIALAAVPTADGVVDLGEDLIEGADEIVDAITEELQAAATRYGMSSSRRDASGSGSPRRCSSRGEPSE